MAVDHDPTESVGHLDDDYHDYEKDDNAKDDEDDDDDDDAGGSLHAGQRVRSADAVQQVHRQLRLRSQVFLKTINMLFSVNKIHLLKQKLKTC